ncbi:transcriptional regulator [Bdellovibrionota bacterium FG-1]
MKSKREVRFRSAREFCAQVSIGISYPQYSRYEAGEQLPVLEHALSICATLGVAPMEGLLEWCKAQLAFENTVTRDGIDHILAEVRGNKTQNRSATASVRSEQKVPLNDVIVFNRSHLKIFLSDPAYRDIFSYINSFGPDWISPEELGRALGLEEARVQKMLDQLYDLGVVVSGDGLYRASKRNFYFPDDQDFFELRNANFLHNTTNLMNKLSYEDLLDRRAYRSLITRELTEDQVRVLLEGIDQLLGGVVAMPETDDPRTIYSLCVLFGQRFSRDRNCFQPRTSELKGSSI